MTKKIIKTKKDALRLIDEHPTKVGEIPEEFLSEDVLKYAIDRNWNAFNYIPKKLVTDSIVIRAIDVRQKMVGELIYIGWIPRAFLSEAVIKHAISISPYAIINGRGIPKDLITKSIALHTIDVDVHDISYLPNAVLTEDVLKYAIDKDITSIDIIMQKHLLSDNLIRYIIDIDPHNIRYIYKRRLSTDIVIYAIDKNMDVSVIRHLPPECITEDIILHAIDIDPFSIQYMPKKRLTDNILISAMRKYHELQCQSCTKK